MDDKKLRTIVVACERITVGVDHTSLVKLEVLDIDSLQASTFYVSPTTFDASGVSGADRTKVVTLTTALVDKGHNVYKRTVKLIEVTGETLTIKVSTK